MNRKKLQHNKVISTRRRGGRQWDASKGFRLKKERILKQTVLWFSLQQWSSTFLRLGLFNIVPHVVVTPSHKIMSLLLHNCNLATVMNHNVKYLLFRIYDSRKNHNPQVEKIYYQIIRSGFPIPAPLLHQKWQNTSYSLHLFQHRFLDDYIIAIFFIQWSHLFLS